MKITYKALADFSIEKGRWVSYNGIMASSSTGLITAQTTQKFSLIAQ